MNIKDGKDAGGRPALPRQLDKEDKQLLDDMLLNSMMLLTEYKKKYGVSTTEFRKMRKVMYLLKDLTEN